MWGSWIMVALRQNSRHQGLASQEEILEVPYNSWVFVYSLLPWIKAQPTDKTPLTSRAHSYSINFTFKTSGRKRVPSNCYSIEKWSNCHHLKIQGRHFEATVLNHFAAFKSFCSKGLWKSVSTTNASSGTQLQLCTVLPVYRHNS